MDRRREFPCVRALAALDASQELTHRHRRIRLTRNLRDGTRAVLRKKRIDLLLGSRAGMNGLVGAGGFKHCASLLTDLDPVIVCAAVTPFVEQRASWFKDAERFEQQTPPVGDEIEEPRDHGCVETARSERKLGPITNDGQ